MFSYLLTTGSEGRGTFDDAVVVVVVVEVLLYVHRNRRLIRDGSPGFTQLLNSDSEDAPLVDFMYFVRAYVRGVHAAAVANSKHWFTTSFLQGGGCRKAMLGVCCGGPHLAR